MCHLSYIFTFSRLLSLIVVRENKLCPCVKGIACNIKNIGGYLLRKCRSLSWPWNCLTPEIMMLCCWRHMISEASNEIIISNNVISSFNSSSSIVLLGCDAGPVVSSSIPWTRHSSYPKCPKPMLPNSFLRTLSSSSAWKFCWLSRK